MAIQNCGRQLTLCYWYQFPDVGRSSIGNASRRPDLPNSQSTPYYLRVLLVGTPFPTSPSKTKLNRNNQIYEDVYAKYPRNTNCDSTNSYVVANDKHSHRRHGPRVRIKQTGTSSTYKDPWLLRATELERDPSTVYSPSYTPTYIVPGKDSTRSTNGSPQW